MRAEARLASASTASRTSRRRRQSRLGLQILFPCRARPPLQRVGLSSLRGFDDAACERCRWSKRKRLRRERPRPRWLVGTVWKERAVSKCINIRRRRRDSLYCQMSSTDEFESSVPAAAPPAVAEGKKRVAAVSASRSLVVGAAVVTIVTCCRRSKATIARSELVRGS
jgi:hypothetical protein